MPSENVGPETNYLLAMDGVTLGQYFARQKTWRIQVINMSVTSQVGNPDFTFNYDSELPSNVGSEQDPLILGSYGVSISEVFYSDTHALFQRITFAVGWTYTNQPSSLDPPNFEQGNVFLANGTSYPPFSVCLAGAAADVLSYKRFGSDLNTPCSLDVTVNGNAITLFRLPTADDTVGTVIIDAPPSNGFLEYRDAAGANPIWDKDTGAQLISPFPMS